MKSDILFILLFLLLTGCAHVFSQQAESLVDPTVSFDQLKRNPAAYAGKYVKLGGTIVQTKNTKEGSQVEIVQFMLDSGDIPDDTSRSGGRFLAITPDFLDTMIYKAERPVAIIGVVKGEKTLPLGETEYTYPLVSIVEIHVWKEPIVSQYPPPYPPYYYPGLYDGWWYGLPYWRYPWGPYW